MKLKRRPITSPKRSTNCRSIWHGRRTRRRSLRALKLGSDIGPRLVDVARDLETFGLLINSPRPNLLRFMPALNASATEEIDTMISLLGKVIQQVKDEAAATSAG